MTAKRKLWFKAKNYGWGWTPASWEGWTVLGVYLIIIFLNFQRFDASLYPNMAMLMSFAPESIILMIILIVICYKTGEKPEWRWGKKKKSSKN